MFDKNTYSGLIVFFLFSFYWVAQGNAFFYYYLFCSNANLSRAVIKNTVHVTVSGLFATWYFMSGTVGVPPHPTAASFKRYVEQGQSVLCLLLLTHFKRAEPSLLLLARYAWEA